MAGRDGVIEQARRLLAERDAQIASLQGEMARLAPTAESAAAAKQATAASDALAAREALAARDAWADKVIALQTALDERDNAIEAQKQHHAKIVAAAMARSKATETELQAARERIEALAAELQSRDWAAAAAREQPEEPEQSPGFEQTLQPDLGHTLPLQGVFESPQPRLGLRRDLEIGDFTPPPARARTWRPPNAILGIVGICAAIAILAIIGWLAVHREPAAAKMPAVAVAPLPAPGTVIRDCPTCPSLTVLPAGRFKQGSADANASPSVRPLHWVSIKNPFAMSTSAVTVDQFRAFITATGRDMQGCDAYDGRWKHQDKNSWQSPGFEQSGTHPVTCASWSDATAYAQWLSAQTGHHYRLPSASEWEYAARGGSEAVQPWSANGSDACANANVADLSATRRFPGWTAFNCNDGYVFTAPVGSFTANAFGLNDMLGNVFQWTEDCWNANYKGAPIDGSARTDGNCNEHELRGGSWFSSPGYVRADYRNHFAANYRASSTGIRLVRDIAP
jgi:formylglycine-generating enzyme required for sulfatase activity